MHVRSHNSQNSQNIIKALDKHALEKVLPVAFAELLRGNISFEDIKSAAKSCRDDEAWDKAVQIFVLGERAANQIMNFDEAAKCASQITKTYLLQGKKQEGLTQARRNAGNYPRDPVAQNQLVGALLAEGLTQARRNAGNYPRDPVAQTQLVGALLANGELAEAWPIAMLNKEKFGDHPTSGEIAEYFAIKLQTLKQENHSKISDQDMQDLLGKLFKSTWYVSSLYAAGEVYNMTPVDRTAFDVTSNSRPFGQGKGKKRRNSAHLTSFHGLPQGFLFIQ